MRRGDLEQALESRDLDRAAAAVREVGARPADDQLALAGSLAVATERLGADPACGAELLRIWRGLGADPSVQRVLTLLVERDPADAERVAARAGLAGSELAQRLRGASAAAAKDALERRLNEAGHDWFASDDPPPEPEVVPADRPAPGEAALRAWADRVEGHDPEAGRVAELHAALVHVGRFERGWLCCTIDRLAVCAAPLLPDGAVEALVRDVAGLREDEALGPWLRLLARHLPKLGPLGPSGAPLLSALVRACAAAADRDGLTALVAAAPGLADDPAVRTGLR